MSIYIETTIHGSMDELWSKTQDPTQHQQWDLRFSRIDYLPKAHEDDPQRFTYNTHIGLIGIHGMGESVATRTDITGKRTSSLKFWSDAPLSLIKEGAGYWQYTPTRDGIRFVTWYDYRTRFGGAGRWLDNALFRFLMAWVTAWSFDRLRLWIEHGQTPRRSLWYTIVAIVLWLGIAVVWWEAVALGTPTIQFWLLLATVGVVHLHIALHRYIPSSSRCTWKWRRSTTHNENLAQRRQHL